MAGQKKSSYSILIEKLDKFIRKYYVNLMIKGLLLSLALIISAFVLLNVLEHYYYFDKGVRKVFFFSFLGLAFTSFGLWFVWPMLHYFNLGKVISHFKASEIIGNHFTDVKDRLLNILQLHDAADQSTSPALALAAVEKKTSSINPIPFQNAIDFRKNKKLLKFAIPPLLILLALLIGSPTLLRDSTSRIIRNNETFDRPAPFEFIVMNNDLQVVQFEDFDLEVEVQGKSIPNEVYLEMNDFRYQLKAIDKTHFSYAFKDVPEDVVFKFSSGEIVSKEYELGVLSVPEVSRFTMRLDYPAYTRRTDESIKNTGNAILPIGTKVSWQYQVGHTDDIDITFGNNKTTPFDQVSQSEFAFSKRIYHDDKYRIDLSNNLIDNPHSFDYNLTVIPDLFPLISVKQFIDSADVSLQYFVGDATDDYGLTDITFNYKIIGQGSNKNTLVKKSLVKPASSTSAYQYTLDIQKLNLAPGDELECFFEAFDNDAINGIKSTKTQVMRYHQASKQELEELEDDNNEDIKNNLSKSLKELEEVRAEMKRLKEKLLQEKDLNWQAKKQLEQLIEKHKELQDKINEAKEKYEENLENQEEKSSEKQENLQELFEEMQDPERDELMQKIQELMQELNKDQAMEMMKEMEQSDEQLEMDMDRMLELFKMLEVEKEIQDISEELEELAKKEEALSQKTKEEADKDETEDAQEEDQKSEDQEEKENEVEKNKENNNEDQENKEGDIEEEKTEKQSNDLEKEQEKLSEDFEKISEEMEELLEKNKELEKPKQLGEPQEDMESIQKDMENSEKQLGKNQKKKASKSQKNAAEKMKQLSQNLQQQMQSGDLEQMEEDLKTLRQLLENLVELSFDQEELMGDFRKSKINTPHYVNLVQTQYKLKDDFKIVEDSLVALSRRVDQIKSFITDKIVSIKGNFNEGIDLLEERQMTSAANNQQRTMKDVNDLALMLSETMEQMQQQMANQMPGNQACEKPGSGKGQSKVPMDKISKQQEGLNGEMKKMGDKLKNGMEGKAEEYAKLAARQAAIREALKEFSQDKKQQGKGSQELEELIDQMNQIETDLVNKKLSNETLKRQEEILTRLLQAENAERKQEMEQKRKSETAQEKRGELPPALKRYLKERESNIDLINKSAPNLRPFYKSLVDEYFRQSKGSK